MAQKEFCFRYTGPVHDDVAILGLRLTPTQRCTCGQKSILQHFVPDEKVCGLQYLDCKKIEISALRAFRYKAELDDIDKVVVEALSAKSPEDIDKTIRDYLYLFNQTEWKNVKAVDRPLWRDEVFGRPIVTHQDPQETFPTIPPLPHASNTQAKKTRSNSYLAFTLGALIVAAVVGFTYPSWVHNVPALANAVDTLAKLRNLSWCEHGCPARDQAWCQWFPVRAFVDSDNVAVYVAPFHPDYENVIKDERQYAGELWFCTCGQAEVRGYIRRP